jgi:formylglycine-generating enzyme required for sulfatase activity
MKKGSFLRNVGLHVAVLTALVMMMGEVDSKKARKVGERKTFLVKGVKFAMRWIPAGSFLMGSPSNEAEREDNEGPQRRVYISKGFWMLETEVTQGQYKALMRSNPSKFKKCGNNCPVDQVSWHNARAFANKLSQAQKLSACRATNRKIFQCKGWRLPTEAEWEYAARAGTTGARHGALNDIAWWGAWSGDGNTEVSYDGAFERHNKKWGTHPVGQKQANAWGLHDMLGNVLEWTMDVYGGYSGMGTKDPLRSSGGKLRVERSSSWSGDAGFVRSAYRTSSAPTNRHNTGFRLLRY